MEHLYFFFSKGLIRLSLSGLLSPVYSKIARAFFVSFIVCLGSFSSTYSQSCPPISPFECSTLMVNLPYATTFAGIEGGIKDKNGAGTGFTMVDKPSTPVHTPTTPSIPGYEPSKLEIVGGVLKITTTKGIAYTNNAQSTGTNSQVNALGIGIQAAAQNFTIETTLIKPSYGIHASEQAGLWFGLDEDNYVAFKVISPASGQNFELLQEVDAYSPNVAAYNRKSPNIPNLNTSIVKLKLLIDSKNNTVEGFYTLNNGSQVSIGKLTIPRKFIEGKTLSNGVTTNVSFAGVFATQRRGKEVVYQFDDFKVSGLIAPSILTTNPKNGAVGVNIYSSISTDVTNLPNAGIDNATLTNSTVRLVQASNNTQVPAKVNGSGGRDVITLVPDVALAYNTQYRFEVNSSVKDLSGTAFQAYSSVFTTSSIDSSSTYASNLKAVKFRKIVLDSTNERHSCLAIGPDKKLYATTVDGRIKRYPINADGTLGTPQIITSVQTFSGGQRLITGFVFDRSATASNPVCWVTHSSFVFEGGPAWDGKLSKLSGADLQNVQLVVVNLPRSVKDHVTNGVAIGPDGALYISQPSTCAMGREDPTWGLRAESLLSGAILRLNTAQLGSISLPINAKTPEGGGTYNPYAADAPLTMYATGVRNAYDLVWHSNGELYAPTNGSASGGNTPASVAGTRRPDGSLYNGPAIQALTKVTQTQKDFLFRIERGGYYGHPNPLRGQYVLNGGNPTSESDFAQVDMYPVGTMPDANYRGAAFDFQTNKSPNGVIEYKSNAFGGVLKGKLLVVRYSQNNDIMVLEPGLTHKDIIRATDGFTLPGLSGFRDPLDLTEDTLTGNLYVSEYDASGTNPKITLLVPYLGEGLPTARVQDPSDTVANPEIYDGSDFWSARAFDAISVSPNPFKEVFNIANLPRQNSTVTIKLYDMLGKKVFGQDQNTLYSSTGLQIRLAEIPNGVYILKINSESDKKAEKVVRLVKQQ